MSGNQVTTQTLSRLIKDATTAGKSMLTAADAAAQRTLLSALTSGEIAAAYQPLDSDLTAIAALTTTAFGRSVLEAADAGAFRTLIGAGTSSFDGAYSSLSGLPTLGTASAEDVGYFAAASHSHAASDTTSGTFADARIAESSVTQHEEALTLIDPITVFLSPQDSDASAGTNVVDYLVVDDFSLTSVEFRCRESDPPTGSAAQMDCLLATTSIFSTNPTIDASEFSSTTAATAAVLTSNPLALTAGQRLQFDLDQIGASNTGKGYYAILRGTRTNA